MGKLILGYTLILLIVCVTSNTAFAISVIRYLHYPIPEQLRARAEAMVRTLRPKDLDEAVAGIRTTQGAEFHTTYILLRIEANCLRGKCMTIIASNGSESMTPQLIVNADSVFIVPDYSYELWGIGEDPPLMLEGEGGSTIQIHRRDSLWVVQACATCFEWPTLKEAQPSEITSPLETPIPPMSYERFRNFLGR